jgi:hypothetical protein
MSFKIVEIKSVVRSLRGCSQSRLVEGEDGRFYVGKFLGNPQGDRTLVNEWFTSGLFRLLSISAPSVRVLRLSEKVRDEAELSFSIGNQKVPVTPGLHFGSECPVDPAKTAIFDFLPRRLLSLVINLDDFAKALAVDQWLGNIDLRQAIFLRARGRSGRLAVRAYMIDHGLVFGGSQWEVKHDLTCGLCFDRSVYKLVDIESIWKEILAKIDTLTEVDLYRLISHVPNGWFADGDKGSPDCRMTPQVIHAGNLPS